MCHVSRCEEVGHLEGHVGAFNVSHGTVPLASPFGVEHDKIVSVQEILEDQILLHGFQRQQPVQEPRH